MTVSTDKSSFGNHEREHYHQEQQHEEQYHKEHHDKEQYHKKTQEETSSSIPKPPSVNQVNDRRLPEDTKAEKTWQEKPEQGLVNMGEGLPALPAKLPAPQRQALPSPSMGSTTMHPRVPNVNQAIKPQASIPSGSDLGVVGKLGAYQVAHNKPTSAATDIHANILFWFYTITLLTTFIIMKKRH